MFDKTFQLITLGLPSCPNATFTKSITIGNVTDIEVHNGMMRYNSSLKTFEGYADGQWGSLGGAIDKDRDTQIMVEQNTDEDTSFL